jgi:hypothetical protein
VGLKVYLFKPFSGRFGLVYGSVPEKRLPMSFDLTECDVFKANDFFAVLDVECDRFIIPCDASEGFLVMQDALITGDDFFGFKEHFTSFINAE